MNTRAFPRVAGRPGDTAGSPPCFSARSAGGELQVRGVATAAFGHRLPRADGSADDGIWADWSWDGTALTARTDRYGLYPLFYCADADAVWLSPSIAAMLRAGAPATFDWDALAVFLRLGFMLGEDTPFARIRALPPGATLRWQPGGARLDGGLFLRRAAPLARAAALDGYITLFSEALRRRPHDGVCALPLSGGRDSRHILLELCAQGRSPSLCVTTRHYPPHPDEDARVAAQLADALDLPHIVLDQADRFDAERRKNLVTNFCADEHAWTVVLADYLGGRCDAVYDGIGGDVLSAGLFLDAERQALVDTGRFAALAERLLPTTNDTSLALCMPAKARAGIPRAAALRRLAAELARHREAANPLGSFFFWNRTRREIALVPYAMLRAVPTVFAPYLDHDLYDFLAALPVGLLLDQQLHSDAIRRAYPRQACIPFQDRNAARPSAWGLRRGLLRRLAPYAQQRRGAAPPQLTRAAAPLTTVAGAAHRLFDVRRLLHPELLLYLLQLERIAAGTEADDA
ncbi:MAG: asparagine synthase-related protein [bacterium]